VGDGFQKAGNETECAKNAATHNPGRECKAQGDFFIWIRRNPLKNPESAKGIQGNTSFGGTYTARTIQI
jgi:hypothetical protein